MQMGGAAHQRCNTLAKLLCSIYKIQKISQILIEIGCNAKTHHMCGQVGPQRHVQHARPFASRTYYGDYGVDIPCITYSTWGYIVAPPSNMLVEDSLPTQHASYATLRCLPTCHAHVPSSRLRKTTNHNIRPASSCTA